MIRLVASFLIIFLLISCQDTSNRRVVLNTTQEGRSFHFMPINEKGVKDITIIIAWPMIWGYEEGKNPVVPDIAADSILSGGTDEFTPEEILELFNDMNSFGQLYITTDYAYGEISFPKEHIDKVLKIASEMLSKPQFDKNWVERIKQGYLVNQQELQSDINSQMGEAIRLAIFGKQPIQNYLSTPDLDTIKSVQREDLIEWHRETITQSQPTVVVTGAISSEKAGEAVDILLSDLPDGKVNAIPTVKTNFNPRTVLLNIADATKTTVSFIGQLPPTSEGYSFIDFLALNYFARTNGPLFEAIRTSLRASYGINAQFLNFNRQTRFLLISGEVESSKLEQTKDLILSTYEAYRTNANLTDFEAFGKTIADDTAQNVKYVDVVARVILQLALDDQDTTNAPLLGDLMANITEKDIQNRLANIFPSSDALIVVVASSKSDALTNACVISEVEEILQCHSSR